MGRTARIVIPGIAHHVTQRGNRRGDVFFRDEQRLEFLEDLGYYAREFGVAILAYCLMTNHTHELLVPPEKDSLHLMLKAVHTKHALRINKYNSWRGHLWQDRFFSAPIEAELVQYVSGYIELNPVRAGMVKSPLDYRWSSVHARCGKRLDSLVDLDHSLVSHLPRGEQWLEMLKGYQDRDCAEFTLLRNATYRNQPFGQDAFLDNLEALTNRVLRPKPPGRSARRGGDR